MKKLKILADTPEWNYWNSFSNYIEFSDTDGVSALYTINPKKVEEETRDIPKNFLIYEPYSLDYYAKKQIDWVYDHYELFDHIYTHDDRLLTRPNAELFIWGGVWDSDVTIPKTKNLSCISSSKELCQLHKDRIEITKFIKENNLGDTFGTFDMPDLHPNDKPHDTISTHSAYRFAVVVENYIENYWFTEKICNCFANKTVPIYLGAKRIGEYFNTDGIIQVDSIDEIKHLLTTGFDFETEYVKRLDAINENYKKVWQFTSPFDWLFINYAHQLLPGGNSK